MTQEEINKINWKIPEFNIPKRSRYWYIAVIVLGILLIFFSFFSLTIFPFSFNFRNSDNNFLFAVIILLSFWVMYVIEKKGPRTIELELNGEGLVLEDKLYEYDQFKDFCVIYKPKQEINNLYMNFNNGAKFRISVPLGELDPLMVRNFLIKYLDEDLDRTDPPVSEQLSKLLKLSE
ncbi:MAG: hypothetical protein PF488_01825 [Patescibacteria group bacterium]|jgi:hypothetical protein|nr:hypothetical protein [Patescibacteria group bacterium]